MVSIIIAILVFSIIVLVHELGHFAVARMNGVFVEEFAIGMGPKVISKKIGETVYSIRALPLGGFCKMVGEEESSKDNRAFCNKSVRQRMAIVVAGAFMNFVYAFIAVLIAVSFMDRVTLPVAADIYANSPVAQAGMQKGDKILYINDTKVDLMEDIKFEMAITNNPAKKVSLIIDRNGKVINIDSSFYAGIIVDTIPESLVGKTNLKRGNFITGINGKDIYFAKDIEKEVKGLKTVDLQILNTKTGEYTTVKNEDTQILVVNQNKIQRILGFVQLDKKLNFIELIDYSGKKFVFFVKNTWVSLGKIITGEVSTKQVAGPIGIVKYLGDTYETSVNASTDLRDQIINVLVNLLMFSALLSANLGVINLMPLPALDGGRLAFMFVELFRGKPIDVEKENWVHVIGFAMLMLLMVLVFYNDIMKLVKGIA